MTDYADLVNRLADIARSPRTSIEDAEVLFNARNSIESLVHERDATYAAGHRDGAEKMREKAACIARERKAVSFDAAKKYRDPIMARSEQCAGIEAQHIAELIRAIDLEKLRWTFG